MLCGPQAGSVGASARRRQIARYRIVYYLAAAHKYGKIIQSVLNRRQHIFSVGNGYYKADCG
jgi:hypothetical protein